VSDFDKFLTETYGVAKQAVEETVSTAKDGLKSFLDSFSSKQAPTPSPSPQKPAVEAVKPSSGEITAESLLPALIQAESKGVHIDKKTGELLKSNRGALGLTQIKPDTAKDPGYGIKPLQNQSVEEYKRFTIDMLKAGYKKFGDWEKALAGYNAGFGSVDKAIGKAERFGGDWKDHLPKKGETLPYIRKIMQNDTEKPTGSQTIGVRG
jgi:hypothetical protein